jgi:predicted nucleotidyltransferase
LNQEPPKNPEAQQVLTLAQRERQITPKLLIETLHMSKATATRRLSELVDQGYLHQAGKGRGTYYTLAPVNGQNPPATDSLAGERAACSKSRGASALAECLRPHQSTLSRTYALTALGIITNSTEASPANPLDLVARFATLPDLPHFFALEAQLSQWLNVRIDLKLADTEPVRSVTWLWP